METQQSVPANGTTSKSETTTAPNSKLDYSKAQELIRSYELPGSNFTMKWEKDKGFAVGLENYQVTRHFETKNEALAKIGYKTEIDRDGDEILVKIGEIDYEFIVLCMKILMGIEKMNMEAAMELAKDDINKAINTFKK